MTFPKTKVGRKFSVGGVNTQSYFTKSDDSKPTSDLPALIFWHICLNLSFKSDFLGSGGPLGSLILLTLRDRSLPS